MELPELIGITLSLLLALISSWGILKPFFQVDTQTVARPRGQEDLLLRREMIFQELEELESDFHAKKVEPVDYQRLKNELAGEAAACAVKIDAKS